MMNFALACEQLQTDWFVPGFREMHIIGNVNHPLNTKLLDSLNVFCWLTQMTVC